MNETRRARRAPKDIAEACRRAGESARRTSRYPSGPDPRITPRTSPPPPPRPRSPPALPRPPPGMPPAAWSLPIAAAALAAAALAAAEGGHALVNATRNEAA